MPQMSANLHLRGLILYGKHFESMYTGSMFGVGPTVFAVWGYVISHTRKDGFTELNPQLLGAVIGCPPEEIETAIEFLCSPDERSRSKDEDGRRMIREGEFDYRVVNYTSYRNILNEDERRAYNRLKKRESRARQKSKAQSLTVIDLSAGSAHTEAEAATNATTKTEADRVSSSLGYYRACTIVLNVGMSANPTVEGEWMPVVASSQVGRVTWCEDSIPLEVAEQVILDHCKTYQSTSRSRGPRSLKYFDAAIREAWERGKESETTASVTRALEAT